MSNPAITAVISGDTSGLNAAINAASQTLVQFQAKASDIAKQLVDVTRASGSSSQAAKDLASSLKQTNSDAKTVEQALKGMTVGLKNAGQPAITLKAQIDKLRNSVSALSGAGKTLSVFGAGIAAALGKSAHDAADFDARMRNVQKITKETDAAFAGTRAQVLNLPATTGIARDPRELAEALYQVRSANFEGADATSVLIQSQKLAAAGLIDTEQATLALTRSLRSYGAGAAEAAFHSDVLLKVEQLGQVRGSELSAVWSNTATMASAAHIPVNQLGAAFATMTAKGMDANQASTDMIALMKSMIMPNAKAVKSIEQINDALKAHGKAQIDMSRAAIDRKGFMGVMEDIQRVTGGDPAMLKRILGGRTEAFMAYQKLMQDHGAQLRKNLSGSFSTKGVSGETEEALAVQHKAAAYQMNRLSAIFASARIAIGDAFLPVIGKVADAISGLLIAFNSLSPAAQQTIAWGAAVTGAFASVGGAALLLAAPILNVVAMFAEGGVFAGAFTGFGATLAGLAGPIGIAVAAIAGLAAAWYTDFGHIREFTAETLGSVKGGVASLGEELRPGLKAVSAFFSEAWQTVATTARDVWTQIGPTVTGGMQMIWAGLKVEWAAISAWWSVSWEAVKDVVMVIWPIASSAAQAGLQLVAGAIKTVMAVLTGDWKMAWQHIQDAASNIWSSISTGFTHAIEALIAATHSFMGKLQDAGRSMWQSFSRGFLGGAEDQSNLLVSAQERALNRATGRAYDATAGALSGAGNWLSSMGNRGMSALQGMLPKSARPGGPGISIPAEVTNEDLLGALKKSHKDTADAEDILRQRAVQTAHSMQGLYFGAEGCQKALNEWARRMQLDIPTTKEAFDQVLGTKPNENFANRWFGKDVLSGGNIHDQAKPGDVAFFANTYGNFAKGVATHVGIVTKILNGVVYMMHDSSAAGHKFVESPVSGSMARHLIGYGTPKAIAGEGGGMDLYQSMADAAERLKDYLKIERSAIEERFAHEQQAYAQALQDAGGNAGLIAQINARHRAAMDSITADQATSQSDAMQKLGIAIAKGEHDLYSQRLLAIQKETDGLIKGAMTAFQGNPSMQGVMMGMGLAQRSQAGRSVTDDLAKEATGQRVKAETAAIKERDTEFEKHLSQIKQEAELRGLSSGQYIGQIAQEINAFTGSDDKKRTALLTYRQAYSDYLQALLTKDGELDTARLEQMRQSLLQAQTLTVTQQQQLSVMDALFHQQQQARLQQTRQSWMQFTQQVGTQVSNFLTGIISGHQKFATAFQGLWKSIADTVIGEVGRMIAKLIEMALLQKALGFLSNIFFPGVGGAVGGKIGGAIFGSVGGGAGAALGGLPGLHTGGLVVPGGVKSFHSGGMAGFALRPDEVLAKLQVGEVVLSRDMVRGRGRGRSERPAINRVSINIERFEAHHTDDVNAIADQLGRRIGWHLQGQAAYSS